MTPTLAVCCLIEAMCWAIGYAAGSWMGGLVAGAVLCIAFIWEYGADQ